MLLRHVRSALIAGAIILVTSVAFAATVYKPSTDFRRQDDFSVTGLATGIDGSAEVFDIADHSDTYRVMANRATVQLSNGKFGTIRDLKNSARVKVAGERLSARTVLASTVTVLDDSGSYTDRAQESFRPNERVETAGYVMRVDRRIQEVSIRTRSGSYVVAIRPDTVIRRYIYVTDISDIDEGDDINLVGTVDREGKIVAERIQVSFSNPKERTKYPVGVAYHPQGRGVPSDVTDDTIEGVVRYPVTAFDRTMGLDTRYGQRVVDVPKDAEVVVDRKPGSVHDVKKGDSVRVVGEWSDSTMVASRLETVDQLVLTQPEKPAPAVEPAPTPSPAPAPESAPAVEPAPVANPPAPNPPAVEAPRSGTLTGRIIDINYTKLELSVDAGMKDNKIDAGDAAVTRKGSTRRFSELKKGDKVEVKGDWDGDVLKATMVDVVE